MKIQSIILEELFKPYKVPFVLMFFESCLKERKEEFEENESSLQFSHGRYIYEIDGTEQDIICKFNSFLKLKAFI